jgi:hypothetical protein
VREHSPQVLWTGYPRQTELFVEDEEAAEEAAACQ